jgi:hypothetical protein
VVNVCYCLHAKRIVWPHALFRDRRSFVLAKRPEVLRVNAGWGPGATLLNPNILYLDAPQTHLISLTLVFSIADLRESAYWRAHSRSVLDNVLRAAHELLHASWQRSSGAMVLIGRQASTSSCAVNPGIEHCKRPAGRTPCAA